MSPDWAEALLDHRRSSWTPVGSGESGDLVFRREDSAAFAKIARAARAGELSGERDRLGWLHGRGVASPELIDWRVGNEGSCLVMSAIRGAPASELSGADLLAAWPSIARTLGALHALEADRCPFDRGLAAMFRRAADVVARGAVETAFLPDEDKSRPATELLERVERDLPRRLAQEAGDRAVVHGDACMPNVMVDPATLVCTGLIDLGRLGVADRYADLALMVANARESWTSPDQEARAFAILFDALAIAAPDRERLDFYLRLDPLTWG